MSHNGALLLFIFHIHTTFVVIITIISSAISCLSCAMTTDQKEQGEV